ncbi:hypothetical protein CFC21_086429 [Triticum aestivum]|uniref:Protein kinase domain-containing protein n=2 Tax=Triticum aestivum TaxID=4565 RepID=A0A3B6PFZ8_WHEAT|nr:G-type lectin S-receptor-like serine/threonine-protein kinase B120 [Triticum aestivum]XP_044410806.1 G-type lectin S-receptor-like serine/threonine-protein kinase B120 [Triticum aestivum]KAF7082562.1 hypothetical protein CFC21_086429 [Triticum aestivum]
MDIAQPAGADAVKLVVMIVQAAQTVRHNKKTCQQLVNRAQMIGDLLEKLQGSEKMRQPEIQSPLKVLEGVLGEAHALVKSCQNSSYVYQLLMGRKQADQFRVVQNKIDSYLLLFPLISHIETAAQLDQILNAVRPQAAEVMPKLLSGCSNYSATRCSSGDARIEVCGISGRVHAINEPFAVKESQQAGSSNVVESLSTKQSRMRRHCCGQHKESPTIHRLTGDKVSFKFTFFQLVDATKSFCPANQIGKGTFGCVYKGRLHDGFEVAIKRRSEVPPSPSKLDFQNLEFSNEVCFLTELQHTNIVKLLGCCIHGAERVLVYEYMANGSFDTFIFGARTKRAYLDWPTRSKIMKGVAEGLLYLHKQCGLYIIHGDLKPSNILLDSDMNPKISDFGIARKYSPGVDEEFTDRVVGSTGFIAPEYQKRGLFSTKSDVYGFGALLLEVISGKRCFSLSSGADYGVLNKRAWVLWGRGRLMKIVDPHLRGESHAAEIVRCIQIALLCVEEDAANRPTMQEVVLMLSCQSVALPTPQRPAYLNAEMAKPTI